MSDRFNPEKDQRLQSLAAAVNDAATTEEEVGIRIQRLAWVRRLIADRLRNLKDQL